MSEISKITVILASPVLASDDRGNYVLDVCKKFLEEAQTSGVTTDLIDLYEDFGSEEFNPISLPDEKDTKILEYQVRIRKAEMVVIFYNQIWGLPPAILKGFVEKVFVSGFAFNQIKGRYQPFLEGKRILVIDFGEKSTTENTIVQKSMSKTFWERLIFPACGFEGNYQYYGNLRSKSEKELEKQTKKIINIAKRLNAKNNLLDFIL